MQAKGLPDTYEEVLRQVTDRDFQDMHRPVEPLRQAKDATLLDTTDLRFDQVVEAILKLVKEKTHGE